MGDDFPSRNKVYGLQLSLYILLHEGRQALVPSLCGAKIIELSIMEAYVIAENEVKVYRNWYHDYAKEVIEAIVLENGFSQVQVI